MEGEKHLQLMVLAQLYDDMERAAERPMHKTQFQMDQRPQHISATLNLLEEKVGDILEQIDTGDCFLNITPIAQTLRLTINK